MFNPVGFFKFVSLYFTAPAVTLYIVIEYRLYELIGLYRDVGTSFDWPEIIFITVVLFFAVSCSVAINILVMWFFVNLFPGEE